MRAETVDAVSGSPIDSDDVPEPAERSLNVAVIRTEQLDLLLNERLELRDRFLRVTFQSQGVGIQRAGIQQIDRQAIAVNLARKFVRPPGWLQRPSRRAEIRVAASV